MTLLSTQTQGFWESLFQPELYTHQANDGLWVTASLSAGALIALAAAFGWLLKRTLRTKNTTHFGPTQDFRTGIAGAAVALGAGIFAMALGQFVGVALTGFEAKADGSVSHQPEEFHLTRIVVSLFLLTSPFALIYVTKLERSHTENRPFSLNAIGRKLAWLPVLFAGWYALHLSTMWVARTLQLGFELNQETQVVLSQLTAESKWRIPAALLAAVIAHPISEEFVFRAGVMGGLRKHMGFIPSSILATALFVAVHSPLAQPQFIVPIATLSFALCWAYETSRNIWIPIALHAMHNAATLAVVML